MSQLYRIADWDRLFESDETRKRESLRWVPTPNKHDGLGFRRVAAQRDGCVIFAAWNLMLQIASKGRRGQRGALSRDGVALTAEDMGVMTGFPSASFERAISFLSDPKVGWIVPDAPPATPPPALEPLTGNSAHVPPQAAAKSAPESAKTGEPTEKTAPPAGAPADDAGRTAPPAGAAGLEEKGIEGRERIEPPDLVCVSASKRLEATGKLIFRVLQQTPRRLSQEAEHALSRQVDSLPLSGEDAEELAWFYGLPPNANNVDLRSRHRDADKLAINLLTNVERAKSHRRQTTETAAPAHKKRELL